MASRTKTVLLGACCTLLLAVGAAGLGLHLWIAGVVAANVQEAQRHHPGDGVQAATALLAVHDTPVPTKDRMVWTLGTLGDRRALPLLNSLHTGAACQHQTAVCQYEVEKAIRKINQEGHFGFSKLALANVWGLALAATAGAWWRARRRA